MVLYIGKCTQENGFVHKKPGFVHKKPAFVHKKTILYIRICTRFCKYMNTITLTMVMASAAAVTANDGYDDDPLFQQKRGRELRETFIFCFSKTKMCS